MESDFAWAIGLYEGEGTVGIYGSGSGRTRRARMSIGMVDRDVVEKFHSIVKVGRVILKKSNHPDHQDVWHWQIGKREQILDLLLKIIPFLGHRRQDQAQIVIDEIQELLGRQQEKENNVSPECGFKSDNPTQTGKIHHLKKGEIPCKGCRQLAREYQRNWSRKYRAALKARNQCPQ
jgi:hypothetical protein